MFNLDMGRRPLAAASGRAAVQARSGTRGDRAPASVWTFAACALLITGALACTRRPPRPLPVPPAAVPSVARFETVLQPAFVARSSGGATTDVAISPDGTRLVYVGRRGSTQQLYTRAVSELNVTAIPGTEDAIGPFFSPDGRWIGFGAGGELRKVSVAGGPPQTLCAARGFLGASWETTEDIVFSLADAPGLQRVSAEGGPLVTLTVPIVPRGEIVQRTPQLLPGGKQVLFSEFGGAAPADGQIVVQSLAGGARKVLGPGDHPRYLASRHLIFTRGATLLAAPFDLAHLEMVGKPVPLLEGIVRTPAAQLSVSNTGSLVYVPGGNQLPGETLVWVDRDGRDEPLPAALRPFSKPRLSPDGRQIVVVVDNRQIWAYDIARATLTPLTAADASTNFPAWAPDGSRLAFSLSQDGALHMFSMPADASGPAERLTTSALYQYPASFSPDGRLLFFVELDPATAQDIWVLPMVNGGKPRALLRTQAVEEGPMLSPDGRWLAFVSNESGDNEVYVRPFPGPGPKIRISSGSGQELAWAPDGHELFYRSGDRMLAVDIVTQPALRPGKPHLLFERAFAKGGPWRNYDVSRDGRRFLMLKPANEDVSITQLNVVLNWQEELKQRVPTR
jgi:Tol biopolymer transport system component